MRVAAPAAEDTTASATVTIGGVSGKFDVKSADRTPSDFSFASADRAALGATVESEAVAITGFDSSTSIAVSGGEYSVAGAPFTSSAGTILPNDSVAVRVTTAATPDTAVEATLTIGGVSGTFSATTIDTIPDAFAFTPAEDVPRGVLVESNAVTITGIDVQTPISVSGGEYSIDGKAFTAVAGEIEEGQTVRLRLTSSATPGGVVDADLVVGEGAATFEVTSSTDVEPPTGSFVYPLPVTRTSAAEVIVRGTASDTQSEILSVRVNGVDVESDDGFATWTATLPLATGPNALVLAVTDTALNTDNSAAQISVRREPLFANVTGLGYDAAHDRLIVADPNAAALHTIDLTTGLRSVLSNPLTPNSADIFFWIDDVAVDGARNRALVITLGLVVAVDLATGERSVIATNLSATSTLRSIAVDDAGSRAFVLDHTGPKIYALDLVGGFVSVLSDTTSPGPQFVSPFDVAVDTEHGRLLVSDSSLPGIYAVDLASGERSIFSSNTIPDGVNPFVGLAGLAVDAANQRVLVTQSFNESVLAVDLINGARTALSDPTTPDAVSPFATPRHIVVDADGGRAFVFDERTRNVQSMDLATGGRTLLSAQEPTSAGPRIRQPHGVIHDPASGTLLVANTDPPAIVVMDLTTSMRTVLSNNTTPDVFNPFGALYGIELDAANDLVFVSHGGDAVYKVSRIDGSRAVLSSASFPDAINPFGEPRGLAIDVPGNRLLVADADSSLPRVIAVDLTSGVRSIVSSNAAPAGAPELQFPTDLVLDTVNDRAVVTTFNGTFNVSLSTGSRSVFSSQTVPPPGNPSSRPHAIAWDAPRNRFIVSDAGTGSGFRVLAVDGTTGQATELSPLPNTLTVNRLSQADGIAVDSDAEIAFVTDSHFGVVLAIDLRTGERVYLTH